MSIQRIAALLLLFSAATGIASGQDTDTIAFPGDEGYGRFAKGGRGGDVYIVTNLTDDGPGSLRNGIEKMSGPRTIVFAVSGTIELKDDILFKESYLTIAGHTAPGDGLRIKDYGLKLNELRDIIIRYIRVRYGDENKTKGGDAITTNGISDVSFDHISVGWGVDAIQELRGEGQFTLQWSIYGETLHNSIHPKGVPHSKLGSFRDVTQNITLHHNLLHSTMQRHPTLGGGEQTDPNVIIDFRNNLIYNAGNHTNLGPCRLNAINNYYLPGPDTDKKNKPMRIKANVIAGRPTGFTSGNVFTWNQDWTNDNYSAIEYAKSSDDKQSTTQKAWELPNEMVSGDDKPVTHSAEEAYDLVLKDAGASRVRDAVDERIVNGLTSGKDKVIDSQDEVGGWPTLTSLRAPTDNDKDGMADDWETTNGLNPNDAEDRNEDRNSDGFTNLEEYMNSLVEKSL